MTITVLDSSTFYFEDDSEWRTLEEFGDLTVHEHTKYETEIIAEKCRGREIVLTNKVPFTRDTISLLPSLRLICVLATGHNIIDGEAAREQGVTVCNAANYGTASVAQHTVALILELCNNVALHSESVHAGDWTRCPEFTYWKKPVRELTQAKVGFVGWGEIAQKAGAYLHAMGAHVLAYSPSRRNAPGWEPFAWRELDDLFREADIVSLHCPLTKENSGLINRSRLASMKKSAFLVNTARGPLIDEPALGDALRNHQIAGAALDVVAKEPMLPNNPLLGAPNCFITPHLGWSSLSARRRLLQITRENIRAFLKQTPQNVVN